LLYQDYFLILDLIIVGDIFYWVTGWISDPEYKRYSRGKP
jgi:hypothetical protein